MTGCEIINAIAAVAEHVSFLHELPFVKNRQNEYAKSGRRLFIAGGPGLSINIPFAFTDHLTITAERLQDRLKVFEVKNYYDGIDLTSKKITPRELAEKNKSKFYDHFYKKRKY